MPDISMCQNHECKRKEECYRYKAKPIAEFIKRDKEKSGHIVTAIYKR